MKIKTHDVSTKWRPLPRYIFRKKNVLQELKRLEPVNTFVDIGCGAGDLACTLAEQGMKGKGFDFSSRAIETASSMRDSRGIDGSNLKFIQNQDHLSKLDEKADLILCMEVLEHIKEDHEAYDELLRMSNKYLMISVPAKSKYFSYSDELAGHFRRYDVRDAVKLVRRNNTRILSIVNYGYPYTNIVRWVRESKSKQEKSKNKDIYERSKDSGVSIFDQAPSVSKLNLEKILTLPYQTSRLFNKSDFGEGYLLVVQKL